MPIVLYRIDERLIHGQVVVGWGVSLRPDRIVVVDDELARSAWEQELYTMGLPEEMEASFADIERARQVLEAWRRGSARVILLTRDVDTMRRLAEGGLLEGEDVNIGGIHHAHGRERVLPYVYLSDDTRRQLRWLANEGATVTARDVPGARRVSLSELLEEDPQR